MHSFGCKAHPRYMGMNPSFVKRVWAKRVLSEVTAKYDLTTISGRHKAVLEITDKYKNLTHEVIASVVGYKDARSVAKILKKKESHT